MGPWGGGRDVDAFHLHAPCVRRDSGFGCRQTGVKRAPLLFCIHAKSISPHDPSCETAGVHLLKLLSRMETKELKWTTFNTLFVHLNKPTAAQAFSNELLLSFGASRE